MLLGLGLCVRCGLLRGLAVGLRGNGLAVCVGLPISSSLSVGQRLAVCLRLAVRGSLTVHACLPIGEFRSFLQLVQVHGGHDEQHGGDDRAAQERHGGTHDSPDERTLELFVFAAAAQVDDAGNKRHHAAYEQPYAEEAAEYADKPPGYRQHFIFRHAVRPQLVQVACAEAAFNGVDNRRVVERYHGEHGERERDNGAHNGKR